MSQDATHSSTWASLILCCELTFPGHFCGLGVLGVKDSGSGPNPYSSHFYLLIYSSYFIHACICSQPVFVVTFVMLWLLWCVTVVMLWLLWCVTVVMLWLLWCCDCCDVVTVVMLTVVMCDCCDVVTVVMLWLLMLWLYSSQEVTLWPQLFPETEGMIYQFFTVLDTLISLLDSLSGSYFTVNLSSFQRLRHVCQSVLSIILTLGPFLVFDCHLFYLLTFCYICYLVCAFLGHFIWMKLVNDILFIGSKRVLKAFLCFLALVVLDWLPSLEGSVKP